MSPGIPTKYRGVQMRSRIEAAHAAFFDECGWDWEYEPFDLEGYIPDFLIKFKTHPLLVEVKSSEFDYTGLSDHTPKIDNSSWARNAIILGCGPMEVERVAPVIGLMRQSEPYLSGWDVGIFYRCAACKRLGVYHQCGFWDCPNCGGYDGDHLLLPVEVGEARLLWTEAKNKVQWKGPGHGPE